MSSEQIIGHPYRQIAYELSQQYQLIKPLIYSRCYCNEWPISYIHRLAYLNEYSKINWLVQNESTHFITNKISNLLAYKLIHKNDWSTPNCIINNIRTLIANPKYINTSTLRICPKCINSTPYIRYEWMLLLSSTCLKHKIQLHDSCPNCNQKLDYVSVYSKRCQCGKKIEEFTNIQANEKFHLMQLFIENKFIYKYRVSYSKHIIKLKLLSFFLTFIDKNNKLSSDDISINYIVLLIPKLVKAVFGRKDGFWYFLNKFIHPKNSYSKDLMPFYRIFNRQFKQAYFSEYKQYLNEFINLYWRNHITVKNTLFSKSILANHAWLPISKVKQQFDLSESLVVKAAIKRWIRVEIIYNLDDFYKRHKPRYYRLYYKPDIIKHLPMLQNTISFTEVYKLLGTTKKQLNCLIKNDHFSFVIEPEDAYIEKNENISINHDVLVNLINNQISKGNAWIFLKSEIDDYLNNLFSSAVYSNTIRDSLALPNAMRVIDKKMKDAYHQVITAILNQKLPIFIFNCDKPTLRNIHIPTESLITWINEETKQHTYMTIPQMAKHLNLSQEFAYQLVNHCKYPIYNTDIS